MIDTVQYMDMVCDLPNGGSLYREENSDGGNRYYSDETGVMLEIWNTAMTSRPTILIAITDDEIRLQRSLMEVLDDIT